MNSAVHRFCVVNVLQCETSECVIALPAEESIFCSLASSFIEMGLAVFELNVLMGTFAVNHGFYDLVVLKLCWTCDNTDLFSLES